MKKWIYTIHINRIFATSAIAYSINNDTNDYSPPGRWQGAISEVGYTVPENNIPCRKIIL
jgi:hypothetical protein